VIRVIASSGATQEIPSRTVWVEPRFSPHRSKRLWKKLRKRHAVILSSEPCIIRYQNTLFVHPSLMGELTKRIQALNVGL
jgi:hypothetical protein